MGHSIKKIIHGEKQMKLTVDILITIKHEKALLIKRAKEPFMEKLVMPGGHVEETDESLKDACAREALEEIGIKVNPNELNLLTTLGSLDRDPRPGRRISVVFHIDLPNEERIKGCKAASDALSIEFINLKSITPEMIGFDHYNAIELVK